ncbi:MAG: endonuclease [Bacteroidaceae bacterium]|nr:endonuclease [Bacteroidaceae bacterium]
MKGRVISFLFLISLVISAYADIPPGYYNRAVGKKNAELKTVMHEIIRPHTRIDYGSSGTWVVFRTSDVRADASIWDMYSNVVRYFPETGSHSEMHIEHSVPKSWWGEETSFIYEASFDLHHLVPSDASANMSKSNRILGEVDASIEEPSLDNGVSKSGKAMIGEVVHPVFEPHDDYKGDFARMYMYVATCYQDYTWESNGVNMFKSEPYPTLNDYSVELLMGWHRQDPVSAKEINRNEAVYLAQNNRNPFIDFPLLAEYLWGDSIDREFVIDITERPYLITPSQGDKVNMGTVMCGSSLIYRLAVKGEHIDGNILLSWKQNAGIALSENSLAAANVMEGTEVILGYANTDHTGVLRDTLVFSGGGLQREVLIPVELYGTSSFIPLEPVDVTSVGAELRWVPMPGADSYGVKLYEGASEATDVFISAYVEGSSYNKAIALYNGTSHSVNIADYALGVQRNGVGEFVNYWQLPKKTLAPGGTFVIVSNSCADDSELRGYADYFIPQLENSPINFNGNDAVALYHNHILIDVVGDYGSVNKWGEDVTLYRSYTTLGPTTEYNASMWTVAEKDDFSLLRSHKMSGISANPVLIVDKKSTKTYLSVDGLTPATTYTFYVTAYDGDREQAGLYGCSFTTDVLATPVDLYAEEIFGNSVNMCWSEVVEAEGYEVECFILKGTDPVAVSEGFDNVGSNGKPLPEGWSGTASGSYTSDASSGASAPSVSLKNSGEYIQTPEYTYPVLAMSFMHRFASTATGSSLLVEYLKDGSWQELQKIEFADTKKTTLEYTFEASDNVRSFRYTYYKEKGNMAIDDVTVMYGGRDTVLVGERLCVDKPLATVRGLEQMTTYAVRVRSVLGDSYSAWSDIVNVTTNDKEPTSVSQINEGTLQYVISEGTVALRNIPVGSRVSLYDMQGVRCYESLVQNSGIAIENDRSGIYILEITDNGSTCHIKVKL